MYKITNEHWCHIELIGSLTASGEARVLWCSWLALLAPLAVAVARLATTHSLRPSLFTTLSTQHLNTLLITQLN